MNRRRIARACVLIVAFVVIWQYQAWSAEHTKMSISHPKPISMLLWPDGAPGVVGNEDADKPTLTVYLPELSTATNTGVVVFPGGGYANVCMDKEGSAVAEWFRERGVAMFVVRYRVAPKYHHPAPLMDAQRAIRTVRARAAEWGVNPSRIGTMGFSAGGHLTSCTGTMFDKGDAKATDPIERQSCRPDFMVLVYPVISTTAPCTHVGSRMNLLGENPDPKLVEQMSTEKCVTAETPPTFLMHTDADKGVPSENSVLFYLALRKAGVPAEMHIYEPGGHGVGMALEDPVLSQWPKQLEAWMKARGLI